MVTHISPSSSTTSLARDGSSYNERASRIPPSQQYLGNIPSRGRRSSSASSSTLVPPSSYAPSAVNEDRRESRHRAPSVSSHASTTAARHSRTHSSSYRRHRTAQSEFGSRSKERSTESNPTAPQRNEFPWFGESGDVEIEITDNRRRVLKRYLLHSIILSQGSPWWEHQLRQTPDGPSRGEDIELSRRAVRERGQGLKDGNRARSISTKSASIGDIGKNNAIPKWRYELVCSTGNDDQSLPILIRSPSLSQEEELPINGPPPAIRNKPQVPNASFLRDLASNYASTQTQSWTSSSTSLSTAEQDILTAYDNLFLVFYNYAPNLDPDNIATAYVQSKILLQLGLMYQCTYVLGSRVDHHLLSFQSRLYRQIAKYPPSYLKLGHLARSKTIFSEALIHVVGQWPAGAPQLARGTIDDAVRDLIEDKVDELDEAKARVEGKLFRLSLTTSRGERVTPINSWTDWLAVSLFRQWVVENTTPARTSILKSTNPSSRSSARDQETRQALPPLGRIYRLLLAGGQAYLPHEELKRFLKLSPEHCSRESLRRFERRIDELKNLASDVVKPISRSFLELDSRGHRRSSEDADLPYLTCTRVEERDFNFVWA